MSRYDLSEEADREIEAIARFSAERWGWSRAEVYLNDLHRAFGTLASFPELGRKIDDIRQGYFRLEHARHTIFYRRSGPGILIVSVLHVRMRPDGRL